MYKNSSCQPLSQPTLDFILTHAHDDVRVLALQAARYPLVDMGVAMVQIAGRQVAVHKIPTWHQVERVRYPRHLSMEQCSSEITARYKASLAEGDILTDLTGGLGIDCAFMAERFSKVCYVEQQEELCELAKHNFALLNLPHIAVFNQDGTKHLQEMEQVDWIFLDPARRNEQGGKTVAISDCEPNAAQLEEKLVSKARQVMVKLSPMLDLTRALRDMKQVEQVHIVSVSNECKELLLILGNPLLEKEIPIHCVNLTGREQQLFVFTREEEQQSECTFTSQLGEYLYEPNASILKAGAFRCVASRYKLQKLHPNSHLYTSDELVSNFPGRIFRIKGQCSFNKKESKQLLGSLQKANITVRNFPVTVADIRKRIQLSEGGEIYLFATTLHNEQKILLRCEKPTN